MDTTLTVDEVYRALEREPRLLYGLARKLYRRELKILGPWTKRSYMVWFREDVEDVRFTVTFNSDKGVWRGHRVRSQDGKVDQPMVEADNHNEAVLQMNGILEQEGWALLD